MSNRSHRVRRHQDGLPIADKISAVMLTALVGFMMVGPIVYSIQRDFNKPMMIEVDR
jgi:hypothetical protein